ncbi:HD domain-containing protein [Aminivibrio sp.]|uniref:HD domain-containing protein n=1 Tax=Aminivibrio sp. TaxID=1872489 RepID=UPI003D963CC2
MSSNNKRIRDPLHNIIEFKAERLEIILWKLIQTRPFQRLRRIKQLGFSDFVYPGATHTRFMHSIGVFHIAKRLLGHIQKFLPEDKFSQNKRDCALAAALLHDIGHGPFSHAFEDVAKRLNIPRMGDHEAMTTKLIRSTDISDVLNKYEDSFSDQVATLLETENNDIYRAVVSSQFDADRLDYMQRDRLSTGTHLGMVDYEWLLSNLEIGSAPVAVEDQELPETTVETLIINAKGILAAESYVLNLFHLYPTVYFHKTTRGAEKLFTELLYEFFSVFRNGGQSNYAECGLSLKHPLARLASKDETSMETALALDDTAMWSAFESMQEAKNPLISVFSRRLLNRCLFKCIDIRERLKNCLKDEALQVACNTAEEQIIEWNEKHGRNPQNIVLLDKTSRIAYNDSLKKGIAEQIRVQTGNSTKNINEVSEVVASIPEFRVLRCYVSERGCDAAKFVDKVLKRFD